MTEHDWLTSTDPVAMLDWFNSPADYRPSVHPVISDRKLRLFAVACCRSCFGPPTSPDELARWEQGEAFADDPTRFRDPGNRLHDQDAAGLAMWAARRVGSASYQPDSPHPGKAALLREIVGNPWISYQWRNNDASTTQRSTSPCPGRHGDDPATQGRYAEGLDQDSGAGRVDDAGGMGLGTGGGTVRSAGVPNSSHQRQQSRRPTDQPGSDPSRGTSAVPRRKTEGAADGSEVSAGGSPLRSMRGIISESETESQAAMPRVSEGNQAGTARQAVSGNRNLVLLDRALLTPTVVGIARHIYDERTFDDMPVLADALEEAGCEDAEILGHLRGTERCYNCLGSGRLREEDDGGSYSVACRACTTSPGYTFARPNDGTGGIPLRGPHVRGCWVLDLILGND
jgi:hypothetical protein